jgi:hypothetical protein
VSKILLTELSRGTMSDKISKMADGVGFFKITTSKLGGKYEIQSHLF